MIIELLRTLVLGLVEGITEWLPISSTGHMILLNAVIGNEGFTSSDLYLYVIQLGAILAVVTLYFQKLNPFSSDKNEKQKADTWRTWYKVLVATVPAGVIGILVNDLMDRIETWQVVSVMLILYGVGFLFAEKHQKPSTVKSISALSYKKALLIGLIQVLAIVPGTSRSGATILGAILLGCSRTVAAEFSFFLSIPIMFCVSGYKIFTCDTVPSAPEIVVLLLGMAVAYGVSMLAIRLLMNYVKRHDFKVFGWYRIILGIVVIAFFWVRTLVA